MERKTLFLITVGVAVIALVLLLIFTRCFGLIKKEDKTRYTKIESDGTNRKVVSHKLEEGEPLKLKVGELCHFSDSEKQSIPYRWDYTISDESILTLSSTDYENTSKANAMPGGDSGLRIMYFSALAPGECTITLRYGHIGEPDNYNSEYIFTVIIEE